MGLFGKKKEAPEPQADEGQQETAPDQQAAPSSTDASLPQIAADLEKLKAQFSSFYEMQKAANERFTRINEQIGELRAMILDREKSSQMLEAKATQAIDLVQSVQPDKLMVEMRKSDGKIEGLKANIESNESVLANAVSELKELRNKLSVFRGMDQMVKMNDDVKQELIEIKRVEATVARHADKVETIFSEVQKKFRDFDKFNDVVKDLDVAFKQLSSDTDALKVKVSELAS